LLKRAFFDCSYSQYIRLQGKIQALSLFLVFFWGPAAFGHFPDSVNAGGVIERVFSNRLNFSLNKPLEGRIGAYFEHLGYFFNSQSFHKIIIDEKLKKINSFGSWVIDKHNSYDYHVSIMYRHLSSCIGDSLSIIANYRQFKGDRSMEKVIDFWEAKQALEMRGLRERLEREYDEKLEAHWEAQKAESVERSMREAMKELPKPPKKKAQIISALPGETIPPEFPDLRPYMQRDGLILLTWAIWVTEDGIQTYKIHWVKSCGTLRKYSLTWYIQNDFEKMLATAMPDDKTDMFYREGILGNGWNRDHVVDYVFICAPELNSHSRAVFIEKLKATGVNVNFDFDFSLGLAKQLQFQKQIDLIQSLGLKGVQNA